MNIMTKPSISEEHSYPAIFFDQRDRVVSVVHVIKLENKLATLIKEIDKLYDAPFQDIRLMMGEMTAEEIRSVKAMLRYLKTIAEKGDTEHGVQ